MTGCANVAYAPMQAKVVYHTKDGRTLDNDIVLITTVTGGKIQDAREDYNLGAPPLKLE